MPTCFDLSHTIENGMITYKGLPGPVICDFLSREDSRKFYANGTGYRQKYGVSEHSRCVLLPR